MLRPNSVQNFVASLEGSTMRVQYVKPTLSSIMTFYVADISFLNLAFDDRGLQLKAELKGTF